MKGPFFSRRAIHLILATGGLTAGWLSKRPSATDSAGPRGNSGSGISRTLPQAGKVATGGAFRPTVSAAGFRVADVPLARSFDDLLALAFDSDLGAEQLKTALARAVSRATPGQLREWTRAVGLMPEGIRLNGTSAALASAILSARAEKDLAGLLDDFAMVNGHSASKAVAPVVAELPKHPELWEKALRLAVKKFEDPFAFEEYAILSREGLLNALLKSAPKEPAAFESWAASLRPLARRFDPQWLQRVGDLAKSPDPPSADPSAEEAEKLAAEPEPQKRGRALQKALESVRKGGELTEALSLIQSGDIDVPGRGKFTRNQSLQSLFASAANENPDQAIATAGTLAGEDLKTAATAILRRLGQDQPEATLKALALLPNEQLSFGMLAYSLGTQHPELKGEQSRLIDEILRQPNRKIPGEFAVALRNDPELAKRVVTSYSDRLDPNAVSALRFTSFPVDPEHVTESTAWVNQIADPKIRASVFSGIIAGLARVDPAKAFQLALDTGSRSGLETVTQQNGFDATLFDPAGVWLQRLPESDRDKAAWNAVDGLKSNHPTEAATLAQTWLGQTSAAEAAGKTAVDSIRSVAVALANQASRHEAGEWVSRLPEGAAKNSAISGLVETWAQSDPVGASEWLTTVPPGEGRDRAVRHLVSNLGDDPESALTWAGTITDPKRRQDGVTAAIEKAPLSQRQTWLQVVTDAALPDAEKAAYLQLLNP